MVLANRPRLCWTSEAALCAAAWLLLAGLAEGQAQNSSTVFPPPATLPAPPPAGGGGGGSKQPWWMLLILVAVAFLIILLVVIVTFSVSWCFHNVRSRSESYTEHSETSQLSVTAAAWTNAATAVVNRRPFQHRAHNKKCRAASLELVQSLPVFKYKDAPAVLPVACLREVVVHAPHSCSEDGCCDSARSSQEAPGSGTQSPKQETTAAAHDGAEPAPQLREDARDVSMACGLLSTASSLCPPQPSPADPPGEATEGGSALRSPACAAGLSRDPACLYPQSTPPISSSSTVPAAELGVCCAVCLADYTPECLLRGLPCGHSFHVECVDHWLLRGGSCPVCRCPLSNGLSDAQG